MDSHAVDEPHYWVSLPSTRHLSGGAALNLPGTHVVIGILSPALSALLHDLICHRFAGHMTVTAGLLLGTSNRWTEMTLNPQHFLHPNSLFSSLVIFLKQICDRAQCSLDLLAKNHLEPV